MEIKKNKDKLLNHFNARDSFTTNEVYDYFSKSRPGIKRVTVIWRIYEFVRQGVFQRIGRGVYTIGKKRNFSPVPHKNQIEITSSVNRHFPLITFCSWCTTVLIEFYQHLSTNSFVIIEVEKDAVSSIFNFIKESNKNTFKEPSKEIIEDFVLDTKNAIVIKPLISEAPLKIINKVTVPTLEKILVDIIADKEIFYFLQGNEILNIFKNAFDKYTVNSDKLMRYAKRRNKKKEIQKALNQINGK